MDRPDREKRSAELANPMKWFIAKTLPLRRNETRDHPNDQQGCSRRLPSSSDETSQPFPKTAISTSQEPTLISIASKKSTPVKRRWRASTFLLVPEHRQGMSLVKS
jgi:hypothetical protein